MDQKSTILDKIIRSKEATEMEQFNPFEFVSNVLKLLSSKEEEVLRRRFGLDGKAEQTLEEIGQNFHVTRERIRQIENLAITKIKNSKKFAEDSKAVESLTSATINRHGKILEENSLFKKLLSYSGDTLTNRKSIAFVMAELFDNRFKKIVNNKDYRKSWATSIYPDELVKKTIENLIKIIKEKNQPLSLDELLNLFKQTDFYKENLSQLSDDVIISYMEIATEISRNPFEDYGLSDWGSIKPKRMHDKIYLILKKQKKPLHFTEIARLINESKFDNRRAYPPTVHNELILNKEYVLVGRGTYALKEWGYKPGVVIEVIEEILKNENRPLKREEIVERVLKQRMVKKNTIHLALTDKNKFKKLPGGEYTLYANDIQG
jgi:hypothetical protein